jgi:O-antigen/teichoic acid export membrane protein
MGITFVVGIPAIVLAGPFIRLWAGERFQEAIPVTQILLGSFFLNALHLTANMFLVGLGKPGRYLALHGIWAGSNLALSIWLAGWIGIKGVALGTALPILVLEPLYVSIACREFGLSVAEFLRGSLLKPLVVALGPALLLGALLLLFGEPHSWFPLIAYGLVFVAAYAPLFWFLALDRDERRSLGRVGDLFRASSA